MEKQDEKKTKWKPTDNRFVAFFDLLGFKDKVMRASHEEIYKELNQLSACRKQWENATHDKLVENKFEDVDIYIVSFSDSIVLFSKNDSLDNFKFFSISVLGIFSNAIKNKIALKGGVAHGSISVNKSEQIYFGQPIIDAYLVEEEVNFLGIVCHNSIDKYLKNESSQILDFKKKLYKFHETPLKCGRIKHTFIDYYQNIVDSKEKTETNIKELIISVLNGFYETVSCSPRRYIDNTITFVEELAAKNLLQFSKE